MKVAHCLSSLGKCWGGALCKLWLATLHETLKPDKIVISFVNQGISSERRFFFFLPGEWTARWNGKWSSINVCSLSHHIRGNGFVRIETKQEDTVMGVRDYLVVQAFRYPVYEGRSQGQHDMVATKDRWIWHTDTVVYYRLLHLVETCFRTKATSLSSYGSLPLYKLQCMCMEKFSVATRGGIWSLIVHITTEQCTVCVSRKCGSQPSSTPWTLGNPVLSKMDSVFEIFLVTVMAFGLEYWKLAVSSSKKNKNGSNYQCWFVF